MDEQEIFVKLTYHLSTVQGPDDPWPMIAGMREAAAELYDLFLRELADMIERQCLSLCEQLEEKEREMAARDGRVLNLLAAIRYHVPDIEFTREISRELTEVLAELGEKQAEIVNPTESDG